MSHPVTDLKLRDLPFAARVLLAVFLVCVGTGYFSALVQLHFQHASPGNILPTGDDAARIFHGAKQGPKPICKLESLLVAEDTAPFNGSGQMRAAFHRQSDGWKSAIKARANEIAGREQRRGASEEDKKKAETELRNERDGERQAILEWVRDGAPRSAYDEDLFCPKQEAATGPFTSDFLVKDENDKPVEPRQVKLASIITERCTRCHSRQPLAASSAENFPLDNYKDFKSYIKVGESSAMSLTKLAQTTHVHLLGFSMLYGMTGLILAFSSWPGWMKTILCPLPLVAQVVDISCWWLARVDPVFAQVIVVTGTIVALGLAAHIVLSLFDLFGRVGKVVIVLLLLGAGVAGYAGKTSIIDPFLAQEKAAATQKDE